MTLLALMTSIMRSGAFAKLRRYARRLANHLKLYQVLVSFLIIALHGLITFWGIKVGDMPSKTHSQLSNNQRTGILLQTVYPKPTDLAAKDREYKRAPFP